MDSTTSAATSPQEVEFRAALDALRAAGIEHDADHPVAARYRVASDAVNHYHRKRERPLTSDETEGLLQAFHLIEGLTSDQFAVGMDRPVRAGDTSGVPTLRDDQRTAPVPGDLRPPWPMRHGARLTIPANSHQHLAHTSSPRAVLRSGASVHPGLEHSSPSTAGCTARSIFPGHDHRTAIVPSSRRREVATAAV